MNRYRIHAGTGLVVLQNEGALSYQHWEMVVREALAGAGRGGIRRILSDRRKMAESYRPGMSEQVAEFFSLNAEQLGDVQWAVLIPDRLEDQRTVRLAARLSRSARVRVQPFTDLEEALHWLLGVAREGEIEELMAWING